MIGYGTCPNEERAFSRNSTLFFMWNVNRKDSLETPSCQEIAVGWIYAWIFVTWRQSVQQQGGSSISLLGMLKLCLTLEQTWMENNQLFKKKKKKKD